jgi:catechol 2,3-dioxygenase-like lactoylglutathione lyase family enzyme
MVKLIDAGTSLDKAAAGGITGACGYRYCTINVSNVEEIAEKCAEAGYVVAVKPLVIRPGVTICIVEDPDGNWVEFLRAV